MKKYHPHSDLCLFFGMDMLDINDYFLKEKIVGNDGRPNEKYVKNKQAIFCEERGKKNIIWDETFIKKIIKKLALKKNDIDLFGLKKIFKTLQLIKSKQAITLNDKQKLMEEKTTNYECHAVLKGAQNLVITVLYQDTMYQFEKILKYSKNNTLLSFYKYILEEKKEDFYLSIISEIENFDIKHFNCVREAKKEYFEFNNLKSNSTLNIVNKKTEKIL